MKTRDPHHWLTNGFLWNVLKTRSREFRRAPTEAEARLWEELRKLRAHGVRFRRQYAIGHFIVEFFAWRHRLAIEVDGPIHELSRQRDAERDRFLERKGLRVLHFRNEEVIHSMESVVARIEEELRGS